MKKFLKKILHNFIERIKNLLYICNPMTRHKVLPDLRLKGVLNFSNSASFVTISFADGLLKPSFFLPDYQPNNKPINLNNNVNLIKKP